MSERRKREDSLTLFLFWNYKILFETKCRTQTFFSEGISFFFLIFIDLPPLHRGLFLPGMGLSYHKPKGVGPVKFGGLVNFTSSPPKKKNETKQSITKIKPKTKKTGKKHIHILSLFHVNPDSQTHRYLARGCGLRRQS